MTPFLGNSGQVTPPVSDGEVPAFDISQSKDLPEILAHQKTTKGNLGVHESETKHDFSHHAIPLNTDFAYTPRKIRVVTIGAGFSGLLIAHKFQHRFPELQDIVEHKLFEARKDVGGTWLVNTYPGVQCDVPSHIYVSFARHLPKEYKLTKKAFPFAPNPEWDRFYASVSLSPVFY